MTNCMTEQEAYFQARRRLRNARNAVAFANIYRAANITVTIEEDNEGYLVVTPNVDQAQVLGEHYGDLGFDAWRENRDE